MRLKDFSESSINDVRRNISCPFKIIQMNGILLPSIRKTRAVVIIVVIIERGWGRVEGQLSIKEPTVYFSSFGRRSWTKSRDANNIYGGAKRRSRSRKGKQ